METAVGSQPLVGSQPFALGPCLPNFNLWVELTTIRQALMRQRRQKVLRFAASYPQVRIKLLGLNDIRSMMWKYQRSDRDAAGAAGSKAPPQKQSAVVGEVAA